MKVLLVHNEYGKYSGEEAVVDKMAAMLQALGYEVAQLRLSTAGARENLSGKMRGFVSGLYCPSGVRAMQEAMERERPDVVNVHNLYPFISPAALRVCQQAGVPVVMTVHNFRLICPTGLFMRDNRPCELCLKYGNEWSCIRYNCEHSFLKSLGYALRNVVARKQRHYLDCVDRFACITDFQRRKLIAAGFPADKIEVIPNSIDVAEVPISAADGGYIAYSGRISQEKGVDLMLEVARRHPEIQLCLAGAVRDEGLVQHLPNNVRLMGYLSGEALNNFYSQARFFMMASRCYEGFPMAILEAAKFGKPMIAPDHGGFSEIIGHGEETVGLLFRPGDADSLETCVRQLWHDAQLTQQLGEKAFAKLKATYSSEVVAQQWKSLLKELH